MYIWTNKDETVAWNAVYSEVCKQKWTIVKWKKVDGKWKETNTYKRFDTLEEVKEYALKNLSR